ncbi:hypothetical protein TSOC_007987 [Tetrabaena socialis]|uniref:Uncharacterized protein n=1 Tax=Tetrabaena socialis TaxID=47790 RepID=A0A2J7ZZN8_9CHLO|nr:hypothetical protein TSOC_007987 [Tetrabaena socialis]|eukprot:PNH05729.1 hypothetical protein TSOC_007987 [Tetrabaena socialis]
MGAPPCGCRVSTILGSMWNVDGGGGGALAHQPGTSNQFPNHQLSTTITIAITSHRPPSMEMHAPVKADEWGPHRCTTSAPMSCKAAVAVQNEDWASFIVWLESLPQMDLSTGKNVEL